MENQLFGSIETEQGNATAMLCRDDDRRNEVMLHWWGDNVRSTAALLKAVDSPDGSNTFIPLRVYRADDGGGIDTSQLPADEAKEVERYSAKMADSQGGLAGHWLYDGVERGRIELSPRRRQSAVQAEECNTWDDFRNWAASARKDRMITAFRGHGSNQFSLATTLHRAKRHRLERFTFETFPVFRSHAEAITGERFDLHNGDDFSMLLGLAQHHGLPTPLLDWTLSPYIAAFFAFADALEAGITRTGVKKVRVYGLSGTYLNEIKRPTVRIAYMKPYISPLAISPRGNQRLYTQQSIFIVTNVADLENFIREIEVVTNRSLLVAADIPISCAKEALEDLRFMGLTANTLFPGLDGACRMMKHNMLMEQPAGTLPYAAPPSVTPSDVDQALPHATARQAYQPLREWWRRITK